jgi:hypothetical protein
MVRPLLLVTAFLVAAPALADSSVPPPPVGDDATGELDDLLLRVAARLTAEKDQHAQLRDFPGRSAIDYFKGMEAEAINYRHGITDVPDPDYPRKLREAEAEDRRDCRVRRVPIPKTMDRLDPKTGIDLDLVIFYNGGRGIPRVIYTIGTVGVAKIELRLTCPDSRLAARITEIVREEIRRTKGARLT